MLLFLGLFASLQVYAGTCTWNGSSGDWSNASNWSPAGIPTSSDQVVINAGFVTLDIPVTINSLTFNGGQIIGSENIVVNSLFEWNAGTIGGTGLFQAKGTMNINTAGLKAITGKSLELIGDCNWLGGDFSLSLGVNFFVPSGSVFYFTNTASQKMDGSGTLQLQGNVVKSQTSVSQIGCVLNLDGGHILVNSGTLTISSMGIYAGDIELLTGTVLQYSGGNQQYNSGASLTGEGIVKITGSGASVNINAGSNFACSVEVSAGSFNNNTTITIPALTQSNGTIGGSGTTNVSTSYNWIRGTIATTGVISALGTTTISGSLSRSLSSGVVEVKGVGSWADGNISISSNGVLRVASGATLNVDHTSSRTLGNAGDGQVQIFGTMTKTQNTPTLIKGIFGTGSTGLLQINTGSIVTQAASSGTYYGAIQVASGALMNFQNGTPHIFENGATVSGAGVTRISGGLVHFNMGSALSSQLEVTAGSITDNVGITPSYYNQSGGTFTGPASPHCTGDLLWSNGIMSGTGTFSVDGLSTFPTGGSRELQGKTLQMLGNGVWTGGDFLFGTSAVLRVGPASTFDLTHTGGTNMNGDGLFSILGVLKKSDPSAITSATDVVTENDGTIMGTGYLSFSPLTNRGIFSPGFSPGTIFINEYDNADGVFEVEIAGTTGPGTGHDQLVVSGNASLGGTLNVTLLGGFVPAIGNSFTILTATAVSGTFSAVSLPALPADRHWVTTYETAEVILTVVGLLPVELVSFQAEAKESMVQLVWETASELNNRGFEIQRSQDGKTWSPIGFRNGNGTSSSDKSYRFEDPAPKKGNNYYRLNQVDWDGKSTLSPVKMVSVKAVNEGYFATAYPNPLFGDELQVAFTNDMEESTYYTIIDFSGRVVLQGRLDPGAKNQVFRIPFKVETNGIYHLQLVNGSQLQLIEVLVQ